MGTKLVACLLAIAAHRHKSKIHRRHFKGVANTLQPTKEIRKQKVNLLVMSISSLLQIADSQW
jgi:hypothetical protein